MVVGAKRSAGWVLWNGAVRGHAESMSPRLPGFAGGSRCCCVCQRWWWARSEAQDGCYGTVRSGDTLKACPPGFLVLQEARGVVVCVNDGGGREAKRRMGAMERCGQGTR